MTTFILRITKILLITYFGLYMATAAGTNLLYSEINTKNIADAMSMRNAPEQAQANRALLEPHYAENTLDIFISFQIFASAACLLGALTLLINSFRDQSGFHKAKWLAAFGLMLIISIFFFGFIICANEYFMSFLNPDVNVKANGFYNTLLAIFSLGFLIQPESMPITRKKSSNESSSSKST